ncbi:transferrin-binding protein-like solute binding protein [Sphingorhabdus arenilitoris]|uniref:Transferrin-binding protein-like solute binding protein n=1 Tax=Sphingorhabdus arenilitoris TaxID=1490041 RepID=A0ABV8RIE9_9SPHN
MRLVALLVGTSMLAACGGGGGSTISTAGSPVGTSGVGTADQHTFVNPTVLKTYQANGATHSFDYQTTYNNIARTNGGQGNQEYAGNATTVRNSGLSITYNPRDAIFDVSFSDSLSGTSTATRFQDPLHRTAFGGVLEPQYGTPELALRGIQYLESGSGTASLSGTRLALGLDADETSGSYNVATFFYQRPGTTTQYVTYGGFLRNQLSASIANTAAVAPVAATPTTPAVPGQPATSVTTTTFSLERGAFVFGQNSVNSNVPTGGTGSFSGDMLATAVFNDQPDNIGLTDAPTYFQWIEGTANVDVNFGSNSFALSLTGTTHAPQVDIGTNGFHSIAEGAIFNARGSGRIDLIAAGGFLGQFQQAWFVNPDTSRFDLLIAGSSIDGAFYGPQAQEVGGSYRIVGGTPDERIDILGVFTGSKK